MKPANILIGEGGPVEGLVKITDFGISHASGDVTLTQTGQITGTPAFLAPEVAQGQPMTEASDVFSLGATLYTCLEGTPPFGMEDNALGMLHRVAGGQRRAAAAVGCPDPAAAEDPRGRPRRTGRRCRRSGTSSPSWPPAGTATPRRSCWRAPTSARPPRARTGRRASPPAPRPPARRGPPRRPLHRSPPPTPVAAAPRPRRRPAAARGTRRAPAGPARPGRRRGRGLWVAAALVALVLAGLIAFWAVGPVRRRQLERPGLVDGRTSVVRGRADLSRPRAAAVGPARPRPPPTSAATPPPAAEAVRPQDVDKAAKDFFKDIPKRPRRPPTS